MPPKDAQKTRASILAAAAVEFAALGPAGARIDAIAATARVNKRMLYHYFGSKGGLYRAVLAASAPSTRQPSSQQLRLLAWAGLDPALAAQNSRLGAGPSVSSGSNSASAVASDDDDIEEGLLQNYLELALQLAAEIGTPLLTQLLGPEADADRLKALQQRLHERLAQRLAAPPSTGSVAKQKVTLRATSRSREP